MKKLLLICVPLICMSLSGCSDVDADGIIKETLSNPDSFSAKSRKRLWEGTTEDGNDAYVVEVVFDAQNGFGGTVRSCKDVVYWRDEAIKKIVWYKFGNVQDCDNADGLGDDAQKIWRQMLVPGRWKGKWVG